MVVIFAYPLESVFQMWIGSPLDRADFWTAGSTRVILQIVWLDHEKDIWRER